MLNMRMRIMSRNKLAEPLFRRTVGRTVEASMQVEAKYWNDILIRPVGGRSLHGKVFQLIYFIFKWFPKQFSADW